jgi:hypothetical protein
MNPFPRLLRQLRESDMTSYVSFLGEMAPPSFHSSNCKIETANIEASLIS